MALISTPEERFENLPDYDYEPEYVSVGEPEMAYIDVDEGDGDETFLCLHGEPTWGYLYRKMLPALSEEGRVVVPDFVGFGRSDKYTERKEYTYEMHYDSLVAFIEALDLEDITLVCQDWGGILGLPVATEYPERFARLVPMNTGVPSGTQEMPEAWEEFRAFVERVEELPIGMLIQNATATELSEETLAAYEAPFPGEEHKAGARECPTWYPGRTAGTARNTHEPPPSASPSGRNRRSSSLRIRTRSRRATATRSGSSSRPRATSPTSGSRMQCTSCRRTPASGSQRRSSSSFAERADPANRRLSASLGLPRSSRTVTLSSVS